jgi:hypothetical protein
MRIATAAQERADAATERVAFGPEDAPTETTALAVLSKAPVRSSPRYLLFKPALVSAVLDAYTDPFSPFLCFLT